MDQYDDEEMSRSSESVQSHRRTLSDSVLDGSHLLQVDSSMMSYSMASGVDADGMSWTGSLSFAAVDQQAQQQEDADSSSLFTTENSLFTTDHYFDNSSDDDDGFSPYIFTDDDTASDDSSRKGRSSKNSSTSSSSSNNKLFNLPRELSSSQTVQRSSNTTNDSASKETYDSPGEWSNYNKRRGRLLAQHLLLKLKSKRGDDSVPSSDDDDSASTVTSTTSFDSLSPDHPDTFMFPDMTMRKSSSNKSLLGRAVRKLRRRSKSKKSSLSRTNSLLSNTSNNLSAGMVVSVDDESLLDPCAPKTAESSSQVTSPAASEERNRNTDFGSWERHTNMLLTRTTAEREKRQELLTTSYKSHGTSPTFQNLLRHLVESNQAPVVVNAVSLRRGTVRTVSGGGQQQHSSTIEKNSNPSVSRARPISTTALDARATADDVAVQLGLSSQRSGLVLKRLRGSAGVFDEEEEPDDDSNNQENERPTKSYTTASPTPATTTAAERSSRSMPLLHVADDLWVPHYEEYVFRAVHAFGRWLCAR